ncbi:FAD-binding oxidoreductase [Poseidonocella sp. HB161398]|uniref:FAD-binding oxidoreductase n=1 Tax=Poseidonocella sp. HB161398 TaxID=2320855 RepID=UPI0011099487|nr:FAD-binding oxidoreductase [Poseidonocella sp. HB161398]
MDSAPAALSLAGRLAAEIGDRHVLTDPGAMAGYLVEERGLFTGTALAVIRPGSTRETAACLRLCREAGVAAVPQGGNTGVCGGGVPDRAVVFAMGRMDRILELDPLNATLTAEAGCTLGAARAAAAEAGFLLPLSLPSEGSCQIGGNLSTNAGGANVLRYGMTRDLVLGLEAALPDGRVLRELRKLRKDNTGYDVKQLFIGAEGTLGIITAAVLKLAPLPRRSLTCLVACDGAAAAMALYARMAARHGDTLSMFEFLPRLGIELVLAHCHGVPDPMEAPHPAYVLLQLDTPLAARDLAAELEETLAPALEDGLVRDAVIGQSGAQDARLLALRERMAEAQTLRGGNIKHDVSVPLSAVAAFIAEAGAACEALWPGVQVLGFGHLGDGNIHFNVICPDPAPTAATAFLAAAPRFNRTVHDIVARFGGSVSAEHGIGLLKRGELARYADPVTLDLMRALKAAIDPANLMNPGKILT